MHKIWRSFCLFCVIALALNVHGDRPVRAAADSLTVKVGFYGGPYYETAVFSDADMRSMSDGSVWTYSGVDSGGFMRLCYAWGVSLDFLLDQAGIDLGSVGYLHMGTQDNYEEYYATFSVDTLLRERYFYPHMIRLADPNGREEQILPFDALTGEEQADPQVVPAMLAIGCTDFSRAAYTEAAWNGYPYPDRAELSEDLRYRLIYGQLGLDSLEAALNVQESDKWVFEINVQLTGAPGIRLDRTLLEGNEGEVGSRYRLDISADLPPNYGYLSGEVLQALSAQVLERVELTYDDSVVDLVQTGTGQYEMRIVGEGQSDLQASYARQEYDGTLVNASQSMLVSGHAPLPSETPTPGGAPADTPPAGDDPAAPLTKAPTQPPAKGAERSNENAEAPSGSALPTGTPGTAAPGTAAGTAALAQSVGLTEDPIEQTEQTEPAQDTAPGEDTEAEVDTAAARDAPAQAGTQESSQQWMSVPADTAETISDVPSKGVTAAAWILFFLGVAEAAVRFYMEKKGERG